MKKGVLDKGVFVRPIKGDGDRWEVVKVWSEDHLGWPQFYANVYDDDRRLRKRIPISDLAPYIGGTKAR